MKSLAIPVLLVVIALAWWVGSRARSDEVTTTPEDRANTDRPASASSQDEPAPPTKPARQPSIAAPRIRPALPDTPAPIDTPEPRDTAAGHARERDIGEQVLDTVLANANEGPLAELDVTAAERARLRAIHAERAKAQEELDRRALAGELSVDEWMAQLGVLDEQQLRQEREVLGEARARRYNAARDEELSSAVEHVIEPMVRDELESLGLPPRHDAGAQP